MNNFYWSETVILFFTYLNVLLGNWILVLLLVPTLFFVLCLLWISLAQLIFTGHNLKTGWQSCCNLRSWETFNFYRSEKIFIVLCELFNFLLNLFVLPVMAKDWLVSLPWTGLLWCFCSRIYMYLNKVSILSDW